MPPEIKKIINHLLQSRTPEEWHPYFIGGKLYTITHKVTGVKVWVANSWYGVYLTITVHGETVQYPEINVTIFSSFFGWATWRNSFYRLSKELFPDISYMEHLSKLTSEIIKSRES
jgi:hypothetical protein